VNIVQLRLAVGEHCPTQTGSWWTLSNSDWQLVNTVQLRLAVG